MTIQKAIVCCLVMCGFNCEAALTFKYFNDKGTRVLYIKDGKGGIESKDGQRVWQQLSYYDGRIDEVWLKSNGGNLLEGVRIGLALREFGSNVKVKRGDRCVSACTVAFLGGQFRTVESGGTYEVHAYSGYSNEVNLAQGSWDESMKRDPKNQLSMLALREHTGKFGASFWASVLTEYFRLMIQRHAVAKKHDVLRFYRDGSPKLNNKAARLRAMLQEAGKKSFDEYLEKELTKDVQKVKTVGLSAAHDISMRLERDAMASAIKHLKILEKQGQLGKRGKYAIRMLQTMFECNIKSTCSLNLATLKEYGYTYAPLF